jgi:hypothetical protein
MPDGIDTYRAKRRFAKTPEPQGGVADSDELIFVVQKHHAKRMHYDLRLQIGDALKSCGASPSWSRITLWTTQPLRAAFPTASTAVAR